MLQIEVNGQRMDSMLDALFDFLVYNRESRKAFFSNPRVTAEKLGIRWGPQIASVLEDLCCLSVSKDIAKFDERLVLCSSIPN